MHIIAEAFRNILEVYAGEFTAIMIILELQDTFVFVFSQMQK